MPPVAIQKGGFVDGLPGFDFGLSSPLERATSMDFEPGALRDYYRDPIERFITGLDGQGLRIAGMDRRSKEALLAKADMGTGTTGAFQTLFGAEVWAQYIQQENTLGALRKGGWPRSGFRVSSAAAFTSGLGQAVGSTIPARVLPTFAQITTTVKEIVKSTGYTQVLASLQGKDDLITWDELLVLFRQNFLNALDNDIHGTVATLAGNNFESLDRVTAAFGLEAAESLTAGRTTYLGQTRNGQTWWDANCLYDGSATDRTLTLALINGLLKGQAPYWNLGAEGPKDAFYLTGFDTWVAWSELMQDQQRFGESTVKFGVDGLEVASGAAGGVKVATYDRIPILQDSHVLQKTTLSNIQLLHNGWMSMRWAIPIEAIAVTDPWIVGFVKGLALHGAGELICLRPQTCGQLRHLK